jgi:cobalt-zinc-cadmium efflux system membrane fusion protein
VEKGATRRWYARCEVEDVRLPLLVLAVASPVVFVIAACAHGLRGRVEPPPDELWLTPAEVAERPVTTEVVGPHATGGTLVVPGRDALDEARATHVRAPITGIVGSLKARAGDHVQKGATLAVVYPPAVEAWVVYCRAETQLVEDRATQYQRCVPRDTSSFAVVRAQVEGDVILRAVADNAEVVGPSGATGGSELYVLGDLSHVSVLADVSDLDVARIHRAARASVTTPALPGSAFEGAVDPLLLPERASGTARVRVPLANLERQLRPDMPATVRIDVDPLFVLTVPRGAVVRLGDQAMVFVQKRPVQGAAGGGHVAFERRRVVVADRPGEPDLPVVSGLEGGDAVVTSPSALFAWAR